MDVNFDQEADALYIRLSDNKVADTRKVDDRTVIDVDENGEFVGIELLDASRRFPEIGQLHLDLNLEQAEA